MAAVRSLRQNIQIYFSSPPREQELPVVDPVDEAPASANGPVPKYPDTIISSPPREQELPVVDPVDEAPLEDTLSLNTLNSSENERGKKRKAKPKKGKKAKCLKVDIEVQIPRDDLRDNQQTYKTWGRDTNNLPIMAPNSSVDQIFEDFGRPMPNVLKEMLREAALAEKFVDVDEEHGRHENIEVMMENDITSDLRQNQDSMLSERQASIGSRESSSLLNPPEKSIDEPIIDVIAEERSSQIDLDEPIMPPTSPKPLPEIIPLEDTIPPPSPEAPPAIVPNQNETIPLPSLGAPPAFDRNILYSVIYDNVNYQAIEFKDLIRKI